MMKNVETLEGTECRAEKFALSPVHWVVDKGTKQKKLGSI